MPAATGLGVAQAQEKLGLEAAQGAVTLGTKVLAHVEAQNKLIETQAVDKAVNAVKENYQKKIYSTDPNDLGIMNKYGDDAANAYQDSKMIFDKTTADQISTITDERVKQRVLGELLPYRASTSEAALKHQSTQYRVGLGKTFMATLTNLSNEAETAQDPETLSNLLNKVTEKATDYSNSQGDTTDIRQKTLDDWTQKVVKRAIVAKIRVDKNISGGKELLASVAEKLPKQIVNDMGEVINKEDNNIRSENIKAMEDYKRNFKTSQDNKFTSLLEKEKQGKLTVQEIDDAMDVFNTPEGISEKRGKLLKQAIFSPVAKQINEIRAFYPDSGKYIDTINKYVTPIAGEQGQLDSYEYLIQAYADGHISKEEKDALGMIKDFTPIRGLWWGVTHMGKDVTAETDAINTVKMFLKRIHKGEEPYSAAREAKRDLVKYKDPTVITLPEEGEERTDVATGQKARVLPTGEILPSEEDKSEDSYGI